MMDASQRTHFSSYREMLLEHLFAGAVMSHLWLRGFARLEILKPQVDDSGYDLVLEAHRNLRHVQMKASHIGAVTPSVKVHVALAEKPSGCVVWTWFDQTTLALGPFLWLGNGPGERMPRIDHLKVATHTKANAEGIKSERKKLRVVPRAQFETIVSIDEIVTRMFGAFSSPNEIGLMAEG